METFVLFRIISIALLGSFGHCIGMCGGIVVYSSTKIKSEYSKTIQSVAHLFCTLLEELQHIQFRSYFGFIGGVVTFKYYKWVFINNWFLMVIVGFSLLGKIKFLTILEHSCSKSPLYQKHFKKHLTLCLVSIFLGILNGLLPCGFVYTFAITATSTGSAFGVQLLCLFFGLSTIPALFFLGFLLDFLNNQI